MKSYFKPVTVNRMTWLLFKLLSQRKSCGNCIVVKNWGKKRAALPFLWTGCSASSAQLLLWDSHGLLQMFSLSTTHPRRQSQGGSGAGGGSLLHLFVSQLQVGNTPAHDSAALPQLCQLLTCSPVMWRGRWGTARWPLSELGWEPTYLFPQT